MTAKEIEALKVIFNKLTEIDNLMTEPGVLAVDEDFGFNHEGIVLVNWLHSVRIDIARSLYDGKLQADEDWDNIDMLKASDGTTIDYVNCLL